MIDKEHPFKIKVLMVYEGINGNNATSRAVRTLKEELENQDVKVVVSESLADAEALISADPTIQCLLLKLDEKSQTCCQHAGEVLEVLRQRNKDMPVFLLLGQCPIYSEDNGHTEDRLLRALRWQLSS